MVQTAGRARKEPPALGGGPDPDWGLSRLLRAVVFDWLPVGTGSSYILGLFLLGELVEGEEVPLQIASHRILKVTCKHFALPWSHC